MSLVTLGDKAKALQMVGCGSASQDRMFLSLAQQTTWTHNQRSLVDRMWHEQQQKKEAAMEKSTVLCVGIAITFALMAGCASTYTKITEGPNGKAVEELTYEPTWWANLDRPDWMDVVERHSSVPGQAPIHERCAVEPTHPTVLRCARQ